MRERECVEHTGQALSRQCNMAICNLLFTTEKTMHNYYKMIHGCQEINCKEVLLLFQLVKMTLNEGKIQSSLIA